MKVPEVLDRITDKVLAYKPQPKTKAAKRRKRKRLREASQGCSVCNSGRGNILPECPACGLRYDPMRPVPVRKRKAAPPRLVAIVKEAMIAWDKRGKPYPEHLQAAVDQLGLGKAQRDEKKA